MQLRLNFHTSPYICCVHDLDILFKTTNGSVNYRKKLVIRERFLYLNILIT